ncbi:uncharacterized protein LOC112574836 [Pomacea canaliculata]|uniref:uncharacterized protein LOC112574836 n=1 Tax=Pomacea canaliculata TaxID=400727 RepID=UPI000D739382|nr:uncharacterized protein LOC112574836 [Pomacea canaliculata]
MLYHLLLQTVNTTLTNGQLHLLQYSFIDDDDINDDINDDIDDDHNKGNVEKAVEHLSQEARRAFKTFCEKLLTKVPDVHLWAASFYCKHIPAGWQVEYLTRPLRFPPAVVREVIRDKKITDYSNICPYSERGVPDHTDGPPVRRLRHQHQCPAEDRSGDCVTCGRELASLLHSLRVGDPVNATTQGSSLPGGTTPPNLQWRDVLVLYDWHGVGDNSGMVQALREAGIPVRVMKDEDTEDVATARSDVVWVASRYRVYGLERKVVVCLENKVDRVHSMSRCTSQLVIVEE